MPITYPRDTTARYVLFRISTGEAINQNTTYPRADGGEIVGLDPDLVYLERVSQAVPDYDPRLYVLVRTDTPDVENGVWNITYGTQKRPTEEIETAITNAEAEANQRLVPFERQLKTMLLGVGVALRQLEAQTLTQRERAVRDQVIALATKVWKNDDALRAKLAQVTANEEPDLDAGWEA